MSKISPNEENSSEENTLTQVIDSMRTAFNQPIKRKQLKLLKLAKRKEELHITKTISTDDSEAAEEECKKPKSIDYDESNLKTAISLTIPEKGNILDEESNKESQPCGISGNFTEDVFYNDTERKALNSSPKEYRMLRSKKKSESVAEEEVKPRIVLTFRSEKVGNKCGGLKIVCNNDRKQSDQKKVDEKQLSPSHDLEEADEPSNPLEETSKTDTKEEINEIVNSLTRSSRRIKPTAKALANKELRIGLEQTNNARSGKKTVIEEDGLDKTSTADNYESQRKLRKRGRSIRSNHQITDFNSMKRSKNDKNEENIELTSPDILAECYDDMKSDSGNNGNVNACSSDSESTSDEEFTCDLTENIADGKSLRRSPRKASKYEKNLYLEPGLKFDYEGREQCHLEKVNESSDGEPISDEGVGCDSTENNADGKSLRRSPRKARKCENVFFNELGLTVSDHARQQSEELSDAEPEEQFFTKCCCTDKSSYGVAPSNENEPTFCAAECSVHDLRVGCSEIAYKYKSFLPLFRSSERVKYSHLCRQHILQLRRHMCCAKCGLFCSGGIFYKCSFAHYFHTTCSVIDVKDEPPACPHCGIYETKTSCFATNGNVYKVEVEMINKTPVTFIPEQRIECSKAFMGFVKNKEKKDPIVKDIPHDLLARLSIPMSDLKSLKERSGEKRRSEPDTVRKLCDAVRNTDFMSAAAQNNLYDLLQMQDPNASLDAANGGTFLHLAVYHANYLAVFLLVYRGTNINALDKDKKSALLLAIERYVEVDKDDHDNCENILDNILKIIVYLCRVGCNVNCGALQAAAASGAEGPLKALLDSGRIRVDEKDNGGWTAFVWAAENNHPHIVRLLLQRGADPSTKDNEGQCAVHWCALAGSSKCLHLILDAMPHLTNIPNPHGDTPLHIAAREGHSSCVVILLARGAKTNVKNGANERPVDCANEECYKFIALSMALSQEASLETEKVLSTDISRGRERIPIPCVVNSTDDDTMPDFTYVTEHLLSKIINIDNTLETMKGCVCSRTCDSQCECSSLSVNKWLSGGMLTADFPFHDPPMLFECNSTCTCDFSSCGNRSITKLLNDGSSTWHSVCVYREGACGWALKAKCFISRGAPVALYCGELIDSSVADKRNDDQYMFALELKADLLENCRDKQLLCVDASKYGSAARFINHSCEPNLIPVRVFTKHRDLRLPHIVLFALNDIRPEEQLTFDYGEKFWSVKYKSMKCLCKSSSCLYS